MSENDSGPVGTTYVVLRRAGEAWVAIESVTARNARTANMKVANGESLEPTELEAGVELRAITARNWEAGLTFVKSERTTRLVASDPPE